MINKHFFKILILFTLMIAIGLAGMVAINYFNPEEGQASTAPSAE